MADRKLLFDIFARDRNTKRTLEGIADSADDAGKSFDDLGKDAKHLDKQIGETRTSLRSLITEFDKTGDVEIFKKIRKDRSALNMLTRMRKELADLGDEGAKGGKSFLARFTEDMARLPAQIKGHLIAGAVIGGAAAAPLLSGAIMAAVTAGLSVGVVAGGIALAAQNPAVKASAGNLGKLLKTELADAASAFVPQTLVALEIIKREFRDLRPDLRAIFNDAAKYVKPLTLAATGFTKGLISGIRESVANAQPIIDMLSTALPSLGRTIGNVFAIMSKNAQTSAEALRSVLALTELTLGGTAVTLKTLNDIAPLVSGNLFILGKAMEDSEEKSKDNAEAVDTAAGSWEDYRTAVDNARIAAEKMQTALSELNGLTLDQNEAERNFQEAVDNAREVFDGKITSLDLGTQKGRDYSAALDNIARKARESGQAIFDTTGDQAAANTKIGEGREALIKQAIQYGLTRAQAIAYADKVLEIPETWTTKINAETAAASRAVREYKALLASVSRTINTRFNVDARGNATVFRGLSHGGPVEGPGPKGVDSQIRALAPGEHVLTAREVDRMGGQTAVSEFRKSLMHGTGAGPAPRRLSVPNVPNSDVQALVRALEAAFDRVMARFAKRIPSLRLVDSGRLADIYARGGG